MYLLYLILFLKVFYDILSIWGVVEAVLVRQHWIWLTLLITILILAPPIGFGMTMFCKYSIRRKKSGPKKKKKKKEKVMNPIAIGVESM